MTLHEKNFQLAEQTVKTIPSLYLLSQNSSMINSLSPHAVLLLDWLLNLGNKHLKKISSAEFESKTKFSSFSRPATQKTIPVGIFEIQYNDDNDNNNNNNNNNANLQNNGNLQIFPNLHKTMGSTIGYHGSGLENWHNILHGGLDVKYQKETSIFGMGIYLAEDPHVAHSFKKSGQAWERSTLGTRLSCVAACEVLNHPEVSRGADQNGILIDGESHLPKHYIIVKNNHHVRLKYLLIYNEEVKQTSKFWITILVYVLILLFVVLYKNPAFKRSLNDKLQLFYN